MLLRIYDQNTKKIKLELSNIYGNLILIYHLNNILKKNYFL